MTAAFVEIESAGPYTKDVLGGKGYGLWQMTRDEIDVPPALVIPTTACTLYMKDPVAAMTLIEQALPQVYEYFQKHFGFMPLISVRSGARVSMPGMMDTILNVGLDSQSEGMWREKLGEECASDCMHRLITMYGSVVHGIEKEEFEKRDIIECLEFYRHKTGEDFPAAKAQILGAIEAVFKSWNNSRAVYYRRMNAIPDDWGTAVVLQAMVYGNANDQSCTGVAFSRDTDTGERKFNGDFLVCGQGEDVVAGIKAGQPLDKMAEWNTSVLKKLLVTMDTLEHLYKDVVDVEFTVWDGKLYMLQVRAAKRTARAAVKIAVDMAKEGLIDAKTACARVTKQQYHQAVQPIIDPKFKSEPQATGIPACSGVVTGLAMMFSQAWHSVGKPFILVGKETTPDHIAAMDKSVGILTMQGGHTSHAAVVARSMNKPCVVGVGGDLETYLGKTISIDGATGRVWLEEVPVAPAPPVLLHDFDGMMWSALDAVSVNDTSKATCLMDVTDLLIMRREADAVELIKKAAARCAEVIVLCNAAHTGYEADFFGMFKSNTLFDQKQFLGKIAALKGKISVLTDVKELPQGIKKSAAAGSLADLLEAEGPVMFVGQMTTAIAKAIKLKAAAGEIVLAIGMHEPVAGTKLILSKPQAIDSMLS